MLCSSSSLWVAIFSAYGGPYVFAAGLKIIQDCLAFLQPQFLRWLLTYISLYQSARENRKYGGSAGPSPLEGFAIAALMFIAAIVQTITMNQACLPFLLSRRVLFTDSDNPVFSIVF